jgi:hypothetical protein
MLMMIMMKMMTMMIIIIIIIIMHGWWERYLRCEQLLAGSKLVKIEPGNPRGLCREQIFTSFYTVLGVRAGKTRYIEGNKKYTSVTRQVCKMCNSVSHFNIYNMQSRSHRKLKIKNLSNHNTFLSQPCVTRASHCLKISHVKIYM